MQQAGAACMCPTKPLWQARHSRRAPTGAGAADEGICVVSAGQQAHTNVKGCPGGKLFIRGGGGLVDRKADERGCAWTLRIRVLTPKKKEPPRTSCETLKLKLGACGRAGAPAAKGFFALVRFRCTLPQGRPSATLTQRRCSNRLSSARFWSSLKRKNSTCRSRSRSERPGATCAAGRAAVQTDCCGGGVGADSQATNRPWPKEHHCRGARPASWPAV